MKKIRFFSYVVEHDTGEASNPYFGFCTLCPCKYRKSPQAKRRNIVELANEGAWVIRTGGADPRRSAGNAKPVYAKRVDKKITPERYHANDAYADKKPSPYGSFAQQRGETGSAKELHSGPFLACSKMYEFRLPTFLTELPHFRTLTWSAVV
jgi:hypothetical protein